MPEHRTKTFLLKAVKNFVRGLVPSDMNLSPDFKVEQRGEGNNWILVSIKDPSNDMPYYYEVRVTEKL